MFEICFELQDQGVGARWLSCTSTFRVIMEACPTVSINMCLNGIVLTPDPIRSCLEAMEYPVHGESRRLERPPNPTTTAKYDERCRICRRGT
jgi:hypothetical protein